MRWHILDVRETCIREFAAAMSAQCDTVAWMPSVRNTGRFENWEREDTAGLVSFPLQRGFHRAPLGEYRRVYERLTRRASHGDVLVCTLPHWAPLAERWRGPVVYYVTDRFTAFEGWPAQRIARWEQRLCRVAALVCPNSTRLAAHLVDTAACAEAKITVIPNATRAANILAAPAHDPAPLPDAIADLPRPVAGVIGNLGANTDWLLLRATVAATPWLSWAFVGPRESEPIASGPRVRFTGAQPYGALQKYARAFDVAVLPYARREPTYSGSSTRFYEHLAAGRPMIAAPGCAELATQTQFLTLISEASGMIRALEDLRTAGFHDGREDARRRASQSATWGHRAQSMREALAALSL